MSALLNRYESKLKIVKKEEAFNLGALTDYGRMKDKLYTEVVSAEKNADLDKVTLKEDVLKKYFPKSYTPKQMEDTIIKLLEQWQKKRERDMSR